MTVLSVLKYPHPSLRICCPEVHHFDDSLIQLASDMIETMYSGPGAIGLAANQVGRTERLFVMDINAFTTRDALKVLVNPVIVASSRNKIMREGCLSFPEYLANIKRAQRVEMQAYDQYGTLHTYEFKHMEAICAQHELDHLDGVLMMDRIASLKTDWIRRHYGGSSNSSFSTAEEV
jgi:peptide deformylase